MAKTESGSDLGALSSALMEVTKDLRTWSREKFGHVTGRLEQLRAELDALEKDDPIGNHAAILQAKIELDEMLYREEMMWLQRSKISWLKESDVTQSTSTAKHNDERKRTASGG